MASPKKKTEPKTRSTLDSRNDIKTSSPLVFLSHDTRDADLAEAFGNLLTDASGGVLQSFRSSDRKGTAGIEFGAEWYASIMSKLADATDVVALLTSHSLERPWILYEAGVAKGKLDTTVLGLAINIPLDKTNSGPFAQFQNCADDEDSLTKLVLQLIRRNPQASPREEAVRRQVQVFQATVKTVTDKRATRSPTTPKMDENAVAKMFEEVKILVRDLPERVSSVTRDFAPDKRRRLRMHPKMLEEILYVSMKRSRGRQSAVGILVVFGFFRDSYPWLYDLGLNLYNAVSDGNEKKIEAVRCDIQNAFELVRRSPLEMIYGEENEEAFYFFRHFAERLDDFLPRFTPRTKSKPAEGEPKEAT